MKKIIFASAAAAFMGISLLGAQSASATTPTPEPSSQLVTPYPTHTNYHPPRPVLRPQQFEIALDQLGGRTFNTVDARGPVRLTDGDTTPLTPFRDLLSDRGPNAVNLDSNRLNVPFAVNLGTCSAAFYQVSPWQFRGGRGIYANETGFGNLTLVGIASAHQRSFKTWKWNDQWNYGQNMNWIQPRNLQVCPLRNLSPDQIRREVIRQLLGGSPRVQFDQLSFNIQGTGVASQPRIVRPPHYDPHPYPSETVTTEAAA